MDIEHLKSKLKTNPLVGTIYYQEEVDSTNIWASRTNDAKIGDVFLADYQSAGYGRLKRTWEAPKGKCILLTLIDAPTHNPAHIPQITLVTGVAFAKALKTFGAAITLKWPNDLFIGKKKLGGILCESTGAHIRIGVGLNINAIPGDFSEDVKHISTSLFRELGKEFSREEVIISCLNQYEKTRHEFDIKGIDPLLKEWESLTFPKGMPLRITEDGQTIEVHYEGITSDGYLLVRQGDQIKSIISGDIQLI